MIHGYVSPVFLWALEKQAWLKKMISSVEPEGECDLEWVTYEGKPFMIIKVTRRKDGHAAVAIHRLEKNGEFWCWDKHRWDETEEKTGFGFRSLIRKGRYPVTFRKPTS